MGGVALGRRGVAWAPMAAHLPAALCSADVVGYAHASASRALTQIVILQAVPNRFSDNLLETSVFGGTSFGCYGMSLLVKSVDLLHRDISMALAIDD